MRRYNILYLHNGINISGGERSLLNLWQNLDNKRFRPHLIMPQQGPFSKEAEKLDIDILFLAVPKLTSRSFLKILKALFILRCYIKKNRIDIIHSYTPRNNILSAIIGKALRIAVIWHERNLIYDDSVDITRRFLFLPDKIICNSYATAERFRKKGKIPSKVKVIFNGVNLKRFNPLVSAESIKKELRLGERKIAGIVTDITERKRLGYFLKTAATILENFKDVLFLVAGDDYSGSKGAKLEQLKRQASGLGLDNHIIFTGFREDILEIVSSFDIFVHTAVKEACSRAILEAMACAKAVVAIDDGGNPELIENGVTGVLTEPGDLNAFVAAIEDLLSNEPKRRQMGTEGRRRAEKFFDVQRNARETEAVYLELVKRGRNDE